MYLAGKRARLLAVIFVAAACTEEAITAPTEVSWTEDLALAIPPLTQEQLVARSVLTSDAPAGPMANPEPPPPDADDYDYDDMPVRVSDVWDHRTRANFVPGMLAVIGSHKYAGNKGTLTTTGTVRYQGQVIGTQTGYVEQTFPFIFDAGMTHEIWQEVRVYVDTECGLRGNGHSSHGAYWQAVFGGPVFEFSETTRPSQSDDEHQPECPPTPVIPTGGGSDVYSGDRVICYFWVEYDLATGEILDAWLMYCTEGG